MTWRSTLRLLARQPVRGYEHALGRFQRRDLESPQGPLESVSVEVRFWTFDKGEVCDAGPLGRLRPSSQVVAAEPGDGAADEVLFRAELLLVREFGLSARRCGGAGLGSPDPSGRALAGRTRGGGPWGGWGGPAGVGGDGAGDHADGADANQHEHDRHELEGTHPRGPSAMTGQPEGPGAC